VEVSGSGRAEEYRLGTRQNVIIFLLAAPLVVGGIYVGFGGEWTGEGAEVWLRLFGLFVGVLVAPVALQYFLLRRFGARPRRMTWGGSGSQIVHWWRIGDHRFTRRQFVLAYAAPALVICAAVGAFALRFPPFGIAAGFIATTYLTNFWYALVALRKPEGTRVGLHGRGVRFYEPA
jgi:hypothetical protein